MNICYSPNGFEGQADESIHKPLIKYLAEQCGVKLLASPTTAPGQNERLAWLEQTEGLVAEFSSRNPAVETDIRDAVTQFCKPTLVLYKGKVAPDIVKEYEYNPLVVPSSYKGIKAAQAAIWQFLWRDEMLAVDKIRDPLKMSLRTAVNLTRGGRRLDDDELLEIERENTAIEIQMIASLSEAAKLAAAANNKTAKNETEPIAGTGGGPVLAF